MELLQGQLYHIYNRGNNKQPIFYSKENYSFFLMKMRNHLLKKAQILAYCLMPNHFHWLAYTNKTWKNMAGSLNKDIGILLRSYTQAINKRYQRTGSLFQQKTKAIELSKRSYARTCFHYIHQNPLRANLVNKMPEWPFSSYPDYAGMRNGSLINKKLAYRHLGISQERFIHESKQALDPQKVEQIK